MEIKIGVQNVAREITVESALSAADVVAQLESALSDGGVLRLTDDKGRTVVVPAGTIGYVELGSEGERRVGFGSL